jgi:ribosomal protein S18 acetylase RimI-like enzyme
MQDPDRLLADPVWHALGGPLARFARAADLGSGAARRFEPDVAGFAALSPARSADDWDALASIVDPGELVFLFPLAGDVPDGWKDEGMVACHLMVADAERSPSSASAPDVQVEVLDDDDVDAMADLVARTAPGPWAPRTRELGTYVGVREDGALVAMAGERFQPPGCAEVSAVCTDPAARGRGLAALLTAEMMRRIRERGDTPFLHVAQGNDTAIRVYERLGFRIRADVVVGVVRRLP